MPGSIINVTMKSIGQEPATWGRKLEQDFHFELQNQLNLLGTRAHELMRGTIKSNIKREPSTGKLAEAIQYEFKTEGNHCEFWIGDEDFLNANACYWRWQNYGIAGTGRTIPPTDFGHFDGNRWIHNSGEKGDYRMVPKTPLEAKNFIEMAIFQLEIEIPIMLATLDKLLGD